MSLALSTQSFGGSGIRFAKGSRRANGSCSIKAGERRERSSLSTKPKATRRGQRKDNGFYSRSSGLQGFSRSLVCRSQSPQTFEGQFGSWTVEEEDKLEVFLYRSGLTLCAASYGLVGLALIFGVPAEQLVNVCFWSGSAGFGLSLATIHIYVTPVKRALQGLFLLGCLGSLYLNFREDCTSIPNYLVEHPYGVWFVGPIFASITGVGFKEGVCYQKTSAFALAVLTPVLLLSHLTNLADVRFEIVELASWIAVFGAFAVGKFSQPIHEDIGDKSVFEFMALPEEEQQRILRMRENKEEY